MDGGVISLIREFGSLGLLAWLVIMGANNLPKIVAALERIERTIDTNRRYGNEK